jgi:UDP-GlcNAc:undecaprenyl-phosphate GlcNAc-1-phosphate transferase
LTPLLRAAALRASRLKSGGANGSQSVPPIGGVAIAIATLLLLPFAPLSFPVGLWIGALGMGAIGFVDDKWPLSPFQKLAFQIFTVAITVGSGLRLNTTGSTVFDAVLTGVWLVWMCNAFNVLDMMDGLSAGAGAIASIGLAGLGLVGGAAPVVILGASLAGGFLGFLVYNAHPARVYMGDAGSLFAGFVLGAMSVQVSRAMPGVQGELCAILVLGVPCFEALFLCVVRKKKGLPVMRASRDHVAQRLVRMGYSVRGAVRRIHLAGALLALCGILAAVVPAAVCVIILVSVIGTAVWTGVRLARVETA